MIQKFLIQHTSSSLLLFFAGWGMDERPFLHQLPEDGTDVMICYDYRSITDFDSNLLHSYRDIRVVAWSMGVWVASQVLAPLDLPINQSTAINGTLYPIDEQCGIPPIIFQKTLESLDETSLLKFQRRMCADAVAFNRFRETAPQRTVHELKEELSAIARHYSARPLLPEFCWQKALVGNDDRIFPPDNQHRAWRETADTIVTGVSAAHYDEKLFNRHLSVIDERTSE